MQSTPPPTMYRLEPSPSYVSGGWGVLRHAGLAPSPDRYRSLQEELALRSSRPMEPAVAASRLTALRGEDASFDLMDGIVSGLLSI